LDERETEACSDKGATTLRFSFCLIAIAASSVLTGCYTYSAPVIPPQGYAFTNISAPLDTQVEGTRVGSRTGKAHSVAILGLFAFGDASVEAAAQEGDLSQVDHLDYEFLNILGVYQKFTTVATGS